MTRPAWTITITKQLTGNGDVYILKVYQAEELVMCSHAYELSTAFARSIDIEHYLKVAEDMNMSAGPMFVDPFKLEEPMNMEFPS